jgi:hypothetical protein
MTEEILSNIKFHDAVDLISAELTKITKSHDFRPFDKLKDPSYLRDRAASLSYIYTYLEALKETAFITDHEHISLVKYTSLSFEKISN